MTTPRPECGAERPGPYPALCRLAAGHIGGHYGYYQTTPYTWQRAMTRVRRIAIEFPARVLGEANDETLFDKVTEATHDWEARIPGRDWDVNVYATVIEVEDETP